MIMSRKALGIIHLVYGAIVLCVFAERAEILSSPPLPWGAGYSFY
ncbi:hypothetical protein M145_4542 [Bacteroides fragilis str. 34-F-2 |nr:hypothetical protein M077_5322 [Bacteroides fragilis str. 2-F-2 \